MVQVPIMPSSDVPAPQSRPAASPAGSRSTTTSLSSALSHPHQAGGSSPSSSTKHPAGRSPSSKLTKAAKQPIPPPTALGAKSSRPQRRPRPTTAGYAVDTNAVQRQRSAASATASASARSAADSARCSASLSEEELREVTREVAARIIQLHWRTARRRRRRLAAAAATSDGASQQRQPVDNEEAAEAAGLDTREACRASAREAAFALLGLQPYQEQGEAEGCTAHPNQLQPERTASPALRRAGRTGRHGGRQKLPRLAMSDDHATYGLRQLPPLPTGAASVTGAIMMQLQPSCSSDCTSASSRRASAGQAATPGPTATASVLDSAEAPSQKLLAELASSSSRLQLRQQGDVDADLDLQQSSSSSPAGPRAGKDGRHGQRDQGPAGDHLVPHPPPSQLKQHEKQQPSKPPALARLRRSYEGRRSCPAGSMLLRTLVSNSMGFQLVAGQTTSESASAAQSSLRGSATDCTRGEDEEVTSTAETVAAVAAADPAAAYASSSSLLPPADTAADKLLSLLGYLDAVEQEAEGEASAAAAAAGAAAPSSHRAPGWEAAETKPATVYGWSAVPPPVDAHHQQKQTQLQQLPAVQEQPPNGNRSAALAESVFDGVRAKLGRMERELAERDALLTQAQAQADEQAEAHAAQLEAERRRGLEVAAAVRAECEEAAARQLAFIDRLMADKDELGQRLAAAEGAAQAVEARHGAALAALKEGWAAELRRQREAWGASERAKRDTWAEAKAAEIKALTVKVTTRRAGNEGWGYANYKMPPLTLLKLQRHTHPGPRGGGAAADRPPPV
jgi:hypothetical protein